MDIQQLLAGLKADLGMRSDMYNDRLCARLEEAKQELTAEGIELEDTTRDRELVIMYAAWLWRNRIDGEAMSPMLKMARNNRLFGQKARTGGAGS